LSPAEIELLHESPGSTKKNVAPTKEMADLCILRRVDDGPLKLACTNDAHSLAAALADGQAFEIEVFAVYPKCGHLLGQIQEVLEDI